jgi:hypothetical protein
MKNMIRPLFLALALLAAPLAAQAGVFVSVNIAPPALPVYEQPLAPADGYIWTPGYWAWDPDEGDYYWVPGTWVMAPEPGLLWTPGYWGWGDSIYIWHAGYWGPHVGFYGGVNYGYGYDGDGYRGGEWRGDHFWYNRSVNNVNITNIHNTYNQTVINNVNVNRVSYNGGQGGLTARESEQQRGWANERHMEPTGVQEHNRDAARADRAQFAGANQGRPSVFATSHAGELRGQGVVSRGQAAPFHAAPNGAYTKGGQPGGAGMQRGAPAYVQHQREAEGQHTPISPQMQQRGGAPAYVQHDRAPQNMQHTPVQTQQHFNQPQQQFHQQAQPQYREQPQQQFRQQAQPQYREQPQQQFRQPAQPQYREQPQQQFRQPAQPQFREQPQPQFHEQPHMQQPMQQPHVQQAPRPQGGERQEHR